MKIISWYICLFFYIFTLASIPFRSYSQKTHSLTIKVLNALDSQPVQWVAVLVVDPKGETIQKLLTNVDGKTSFVVHDTLCNKILLRVSTMGFEHYSSGTVQCDDQQPESSIFLKPLPKVLDQATIVQKKVLMSGEKLVYLVKHDNFSVTTPGSDFFRKLPGVMFVSGSVKLNGRDGVLILIDGKGELASQKEQLAILSSLTLKDIIRVEIISSPSARYDANVTSVINVITKNSKGRSTVKAGIGQLLFPQKNIAGSAYISASSSASLNFMINRVRATLLAGIGNNRSIENPITRTSVKDMLKYDWRNESVNTTLSVHTNLGLEYEFNSLSSIGLGITINATPSILINTSEYYAFYNYLTGLPDSGKVFNRNYNDSRKNIRTTAQYRYLLNKKKNTVLNINMILSNASSAFDNRITRSDTNYNNGSENGLTRFNSHTDISNASLILSNFIKKPFLSTETGLKLNSLKNHSVQQTEPGNQDFNYKETLYSFFISSRWTRKKLIFLAELRSELLRSSIGHLSRNYEKETMDSSYLKIFPHFMLQWDINKDWQARITYIKRVRRPFIADINPAARFNGVLQQTIGNTRFQPAYFNRLEGMLHYKNLFITPYFEIISNKRVFTPGADPFLLVTRNFGKQYATGLSISHDFKIKNVFTTNLTSFFSHTNTPVNLNGDSFDNINLFAITGAFELTPAKNTRLLADVYYQAPLRTEYHKFKTYFSSSLTVRQLLVKNALSLNLTITDPAGVERNNYDIIYPSQSGSYRVINNNRGVFLQMVYNFPFGQKFKKQTYKTKDDGEIRTE